MKRTRLKPRSAKSILAAPLHTLVRGQVFARDGHRCLLADRSDTPPCFGVPLTPHHLRKSIHGGRYELENLVTLCSFHNDWVEQWPVTAHDLGLVCRRGDTIEECWARMRAAGLVA